MSARTSSPLHEIGKAAGAGVGVILRIGRMEIAVIALPRPFDARSVDLATVEAAALFRIAENVVGARNLLEFLFRLLVSRIEIGMQLFGQSAVGRADLVLRGLSHDAQDRVGILVHASLLSDLTSIRAQSRQSRIA